MVQRNVGAVLEATPAEICLADFYIPVVAFRSDRRENRRKIEQLILKITLDNRSGYLYTKLPFLRSVANFARFKIKRYEDEMPTINQLVKKGRKRIKKKDQHPGPERGAAEKGRLHPCVYLDTEEAELGPA
jgi:hypothetical protein